MIQRIMIADYNQLLNTPIENKDLSSFSPKDASDNKIYHHLGATTEKLEHNGLYRSDGSNWIALDSTEELQKYQQKLTAVLELQLTKITLFLLRALPQGLFK